MGKGLCSLIVAATLLLCLSAFVRVRDSRRSWRRGAGLFAHPRRAVGQAAPSTSALNATRSADTAADEGLGGGDSITYVDVSSFRIVASPGAAAAAADSDLAPSPAPASADDFDPASFGNIFRQCAPYIAMHRGSIVVIHIPGHALQHRNTFEYISDDISIMHLLGVQIVLVVGVRDQLDVKLQQQGTQLTYHNGMRITDEDTLRLLKETSGAARFEIESSLARGFRGRSPGQQGINVVSGNFFYTAKPLGVRDGIDFKFTGEVRRIESDNIRNRLESGDVVLLTSLGYSPSGESFNVPSESLAAECAAKLKANKIIFLTEGEILVDTRKDRPVQSLRLGAAIALLDQWGIQSSTYNHVDADDVSPISCDDSTVPVPVAAAAAIQVVPGTSAASAERERERESGGCEDAKLASFKRLIARSVYSLNGGVKRAHLLFPGQGQLLKELYTRDGAGVLISRDVYEGIRQAQASDVRAVQDLISPLVKEGILVPRSRDQLEKDMQHCYVLTRDGTMLACAMLKQYGESHAEVSCLAVHEDYRREGRGETILAYLERRALTMGIKQLFVLSTRTMLWFEERGFAPAEPSLLPPTRAYNATRGSKVYLKSLGSQRDVDAEELLWNMV